MVLGNTERDLHIALDEFYNYCQNWKLQINITKTKVVIFGARKTDGFLFKLGDEIVQITDRYKYLGIYFSQSRSLFECKKTYRGTGEKGYVPLVFPNK